ncbi:MBL fold metallo-hydrolase [Paracoccus sp. J39]|uniref:MBL fold metallo-hydrolase n=1 Tax=Paracoccus sp. J39 TaxID=935848 RepID=UPI0004ADE948|nr:MBL fold metallo-hydrolase [Paracoccus sp. J39]
MKHVARKSRSIPFLTEEEPDYGAAREMLPGVRRIVAQNPGVMTYHGTNTYLVEGDDGIIVIDPGPNREDHVEAILVAAGGRISDILVSHGHHDHVGAVDMLRARTGARVHGADIAPMLGAAAVDAVLADGARIGLLRALATPGHTLDHFCFLREGDGLLFSGDHVLTWSSTIVSPRHGDMLQYMRSLELLIARDDPLLLPAHGPMMQNPQDFYRALLDLRLRRENAVLQALETGPKSLDDLVRRIYPHQTHPMTIEAAGHNLVSHLGKLIQEGRVAEQAPKVWARID